MKRHILKNPRTRRMLDLISPTLSLGNQLPQIVTCAQENEETEIPLAEDPEYHSLEETSIANQNDIESNEEDRQISTSNNTIFNPNINTVATVSPSRSSSSSSFLDLECINKYYNSEVSSPTVISNLSMILDNVDFVASPSAIYKTVRSNTPNNISRQQNFEQTRELELKEVFPSCSTEDSNNVPDSLDYVVNVNVNVTHENTLTLGDTSVLLQNEDDTLTGSRNTILEIDEIAENSYIELSNVGCNENDRAINLESLGNQENPQGAADLIPNSFDVIEDHGPLHSPTVTTSSSVYSDVDDRIENNFTNKTLTRKRRRNECEWIDNKNKNLKNSGQEYIGARSKKKHAAKSVGPTCSCKKKCGETFSEEERKTIFNDFYRLQDHELQWQYIVRHVEATSIKRMTLNRKNNRIQTIKYFFKKEEVSIQVCKFFFLKTIQVSEQVVFTALEKINKNESLIDHRGTHLNRPHKMSQETETSVREHIKLFPAIESHYIRKQSKRQYLSENLNISKMYRLYTNWFENQSYSPESKGTKRQYESVFNTQFNYSFFKPKKDLCGTCSLYEQADEVRKLSLEEKYRQHIDRKEKVRQMKQEEKALSDKKYTTVAVFDLEKVLNIPQSEVGIFHYKRKYPIYNFTVYNALTKSGYCYVWHLSIAKRGSIEIGSCLLNFIQEESRRGIKNISFYSDGCAGQNKNRFIFALYLYAMQKYNLDHISHRFYETGHSQNEGDSMHSCVERAMKNKILFTPDQVYSVIVNAKVTGERFNVKEMEQSNFYNIKELILGKNWAVDVEGKKILWNKVMEVKVSSSEPHIVKLKYNFDDEYLRLNTQVQMRSRRGKKATAVVEPSGFTHLKQMYNQPIKISRALWVDLQSLCRSEAIPHFYHNFYNSLQTDDNAENHDDSSESSDNDD